MSEPSKIRKVDLVNCIMDRLGGSDLSAVDRGRVAYAAGIAAGSDPDDELVILKAFLVLLGGSDFVAELESTVRELERTGRELAGRPTK